MHFQKLSKHIQDAIALFPKDKVFQERYGHDPELDALDEELFKPAVALRDILATFNFKYAIKGRKFNNITPMVWCYLWCIESPFVKDVQKKATSADLDLFFYVLENGVEDIGVIDTATKSFGWCEKNGLKAEDGIEAVNTLITAAFAPLKMFPHTKEVMGKQICFFDADWITSLCSKVHTVTGYTPDYIMKKMSLTAACYYYIQYSRMQGVQNIERIPDEEVMKQQADRTCTMIIDRLIELNVVTEADRDELFKTMTTPPDK